VFVFWFNYNNLVNFESNHRYVMSLNYQDHQRTRYWRTHGEIYDFRKERVVNRTTIEEDREKVSLCN